MELDKQAPEQKQPTKKEWELEAERMLQANLLRKGRIVTPATKERYRRKAYRLLMDLHAREFWRLQEIPPTKDHRSRRILSTRRQIKALLTQQSREMLRAAVSVAEHKKVIGELKERVKADRQAQLEAFRKEQAERDAKKAEEAAAAAAKRAEDVAAAEVAKPLWQREVEREIEEAKAEYYARHGKPEKKPVRARVRPKYDEIEIKNEISRTRAYVRRQERLERERKLDREIAEAKELARQQMERSKEHATAA